MPGRKRPDSQSPTVMMRESAASKLADELDYYRRWLARNATHRDVPHVRAAMRKVERGDNETWNDWSE